MSCTTTVRGQGGNLSTCGSNNTNHVITYPGRIVLRMLPYPSPGNCSFLRPVNEQGITIGSDGFTSVQSITYSAGCEPLRESAYDCLNGGCIPKSAYGTPGVFANLANCLSGCATNSTCRGECVSPEQIAALQQAANAVRPRLCK